MSDEKHPNQSHLVPIGSHELATRSSALVRRGLEALTSQQARVVRFPLENSMSGKLYVLDRNVPMNSGMEAKEAIEARGDITVPAGKKLRLIAVNVQAADLSPLTVLKADDLQELILSGPELNDAGLVHIKGLTGLKVLYLIYTQVSDAGLALLSGMTKLEGLALHNGSPPVLPPYHLLSPGGPSLVSDLRLWGKPGKITDAGLVHLQSLTGLKELDLSGTHVTDAGLLHLSGMIKLDVLGLNWTDVSDAGLVHIQGLTRLKEVYLKRTRVSDAGLLHLSGMTSLQLLNLSDTQVSDAGLVHLMGMRRLERLALESTQVSDAGLAHLQTLTGLKELYLSGTRVSDTGLGTLRQMLLNCHIYPEGQPKR